ncbi:MAG: hypothetical protein HZR80_00955 [Candidatus Heimdallarchaeota archaeon]
MVKIYIANVGVNRSDEKRGMMSPLFADGTFEFIPIKEANNSITDGMPTYSSLKSFNSDKLLTAYLPKKVHNYTSHNDPEFKTFTYGDVTTNPRSYNLKKVKKGDYLFFLARLTPYLNDRFIRNEGSFYIVGYFVVEGVYSTEKELKVNREKIKQNNHYIKYENNPNDLGSFLVIKGDIQQSKRFIKTIKVNRSFCDRFFLDSKGQSFNWDDKKTENQIIGSYTRTIRAILDSEKYPKKTKKILNYINIQD